TLDSKFATGISPVILRFSKDDRDGEDSSFDRLRTNEPVANLSPRVLDKILEKVMSKGRQQGMASESLSPIDAVKDFLEKKKMHGKRLRIQNLEPAGFLLHSRIMNWKDDVAGGIAEAFGVDLKKAFLEKLPPLPRPFTLDPNSNQEDLRRFLEAGMEHVDELIESAVTQNLVQGFVPSSLKRYEGNYP
ncbi:MAG: hypothetical protein HY211_03940, partial [Candidatus Omnitrophica bacterium]|nr:hypothetical protein [Candidatus Omnitrophota bacterium]